MVPSRTVIGAFLYLCRQLYNTCEGLLVLYPYDLHTVISLSLKQVTLLILEHCINIRYIGIIVRLHVSE